MTIDKAPKKISFFKKIVFIASFISFVSSLKKLEKELEIETEKLKEINTLDKYLIQKSNFNYELNIQLNKIEISKNKLTSQLEGFDVSKNLALRKMSESFSVIDEALRLLKEINGITDTYLAMFNKKDYLGSFNLFKNFLDKEGKVFNTQTSMESLVVNPVYREAFDGLANSGALLSYTNKEEFSKVSADFEVFTKWYRNNKELNQAPESRACFALMDYCSGNIESAKLELNKMYDLSIDEKATKLKVHPNLIPTKETVETLTSTMNKESGKSELPFFYQNFPKDFLQLVVDIGSKIIDEKINTPADPKRVLRSII